MYILSNAVYDITINNINKGVIMNPLEILRREMDKEYLAVVEEMIADGATWEFANFTNEAALEGPETPEGLRTYLVVVNLDEEDFEVSDAFEEMVWAKRK